jgi:Mn2+/Fe2+ NRAMP family transporter
MNHSSLLPLFTPNTVPSLPSIRKMLGPGIILLALAQGSGELIWWPYLISKYGLAFLFLLLPACLLQFPINYEIGRYTIVTGENIFHGFIRINKRFALMFWLFMVVAMFWFGAYASAGGTALAELTRFPQGWSPRGQSLFWGYASIALFLIAIFINKRVYVFIERFMLGVAITTLIGLVWSCVHPEVLNKLPAFLKGIIIPETTLTRPWEAKDFDVFITAVTFAGLGGFFNIFYSYWMKEKGAGMAQVGAASVPADTSENRTHHKRWLRYLFVDNAIGVGGNILTTLMMCLLAYSFLSPGSIIPEGWKLTVAQSVFFEKTFGAIGRILFLIVAGAFLCDTWLTLVDAVSRAHSDFLYTYFPSLRSRSQKWWYVLVVIVLTIITCTTMLLNQPGSLLLLTGILNFIAMVIYCVALIYLNYYVMAKHLPQWAMPGIWFRAAITLSSVCYTAFSIVYLWNVLR